MHGSLEECPKKANRTKYNKISFEKNYLIKKKNIRTPITQPN
jgi:hypothetical protein